MAYQESVEVICPLRLPCKSETPSEPNTKCQPCLTSLFEARKAEDRGYAEANNCRGPAEVRKAKVLQISKSILSKNR